MLLWPLFRTISYSSFLLNGLQLLVCYVKIVIWIGSDHFFRCIISSFLIVGWSKLLLQGTHCCSSGISSTSSGCKPNKHGSWSTGGSKWTHILSLQPSKLWWHGSMWQSWCKWHSFFSTFQSVRYNQSNDVLTTHALFNICLTVQDRMVSFWLCWFERTTQGKVVLFGLCRIAETQEREVMLTIFRLLVHIQCICC